MSEENDHEPIAIPNRAPARRERIRPALLWFLAATGGTILALFVLAVQWKDGRKVARIDVAGAAIFADKDLRARTGVATGSVIDTVSLKRVRARLESHPYVRDARVSRSYPDALSIAIDERVPVASFTVKGSVRYVDEEAKKHGVKPPYKEAFESWQGHTLPIIAEARARRCFG